MKIVIDERVFNGVYLPYLEAPHRTQIFFGGAASGKSVFLAQRCIYDLLKGGRNYLICRAVGRTLRRSTFNEVLKVIDDWGVQGLFDVRRSDAVITCANGYQAIFVGLDDTEKIKSVTPETGAVTDVWVEEATETDYNTIKNLYKRQRGGDEKTPKRLTLSFNPILKNHWLYTHFFAPIAWADDQRVYEEDGLLILKTTYLDNAFLTEQDRAGLENEKDRYYYSVYTLGHWGVLGNAIFTNWRVEDLSALRDSFDNLRFGLDFGFASDPSALVCSHYDRKRKTIYIFGELYEAGMTNDVLAAEIKPIVGRHVIYADSAEPKSIQELREYGLNIYPTKKGRDSVIFGIQWLQQHTIVVDSGCVNMRAELSQYRWKETRDGIAMRQPADQSNHLIDALRYAYNTDMQGGVWVSSPQGV